MNKSIRRVAIGLTVAGLAAGAALAQSTSAGTDPSTSTGQGYAAAGRAWHRHAPGQHFARLFRKLGLSADQKTQVQGILADALAAQQKDAAQRQAARAQMAALANPGDPNYAAAVQTAKTRAADAIQRRSDLQVALYNVLTPQQKAQLTQLIAERRAQRAASLQGRHSGTAAST